MHRRDFLRTTAFGSALWVSPGLFAEQLTRTPAVGEGPFYPDKMPLDTDNDLLILNDSLTPAVGDITHLSGRVLNASGGPVRNAFVEIWQCDNNGAYLHSGTSNQEKRDKNFQGYGRFLTDSTGQYYFRTIKPVPYPGRTPHIHFAISRQGQRVLTTQLFIRGHAQNASDGLYRSVRDETALACIQTDFVPIPDSKLGELAAHFDLVLGVTPREEQGALITGLGKSERESGRDVGGPRRGR